VQLKALLARDLYNSTSTYYMIYNPTNPIYRKAMEIICSDKYNKLLKK